MSIRSILSVNISRHVAARWASLIAAISLVTIPLLPGQAKAAEADFGDIAMRVARMLAEEHYSQHPFDDVMSERLLDNYIRILDFGRQYFTQEDIDGFYEKYRHTLDDDVKAKNLSAAHEIYAVYLDRVKSRVAKVKEILAAQAEDRRRAG